MKNKQSEKKFNEHGFRGQPVHLIPTLNDGEREGRLTSILLAVLTMVPEYRKLLMASVNQRVGKRTKLHAWREINFDLSGPKGPKKDGQRQDGAIVLETGRKTWKALIEAKANKAEATATQVERYLKRAREKGFNALITISNQFVAMPTHHPLPIAKTQLRTVDLYHWSWTYVVTQAELLLADTDFVNEERRFIVSEMVNYFRHDKSGVQGFTQMNASWGEVVDMCRTASSLSHNNEDLRETVGSWHQEQRELCLTLWTRVETEVSLKLSRDHQKDPRKRLDDDARQLAKTRLLDAEIVVPNAASTIHVIADLKGQHIGCSMTLKAPEDKKSTKAKTQWLIKQLKSVPDGKEGSERVLITARRPGWTSPMTESLSTLRLHPGMFDGDNSQSGAPTSFEISMKKNLGRKFANRKTFIKELENLVPEFYELVGEKLKAWVPAAPKLRKKSVADQDESGLGQVSGDDIDKPFGSGSNDHSSDKET